METGSKTVVSKPTGNNTVKSIIIYTEKEKGGDLGLSLINYISNDGSSVIAPTKTERELNREPQIKWVSLICHMN